MFHKWIVLMATFLSYESHIPSGISYRQSIFLKIMFVVCIEILWEFHAFMWALSKVKQENASVNLTPNDLVF